MALEVAQVLKGRYRVESVLGEGGMGTVYLAHDLLFDCSRAIKELYPDPLADEARLHAARVQFEKEAQALKRLRHRNLPRFTDYFSIDENDYLVMEYIEGESLGDILARKKRPTEPLVYEWLEQILDALSYCHQHHVLHRDIKPANIILTPEGKLMLVDFSLVKIVDPYNPRTATIVRGLGTPQYTPLEQYDSTQGHTDARSDIYALGATLYHLLTGRPPQPVSQRILKPDTQPAMQELNPKVSVWMARFVQKAMAIRPEDRYPDVGHMRQDLETQVFKFRQDTRARGAAPGDAGPARQQSKPSGDERQDYRYGPSRTGRQRQAPRKLIRDAPRLLPVVLPMLVPVTVILTLTIMVAMIFSTGSSFLAIAIGAPLVFSALVYQKLVSNRHKRPPKF
jgi:serine/threonine protein kinase